MRYRRRHTGSRLRDTDRPEHKALRARTIQFPPRFLSRPAVPRRGLDHQVRPQRFLRRPEPTGPGEAKHTRSSTSTAAPPTTRTGTSAWPAISSLRSS